MIIAGRWPRAIFYDSKTTLFDWGWSWTRAAAALVTKYGAKVDAAAFTRTWVRFFESHHRRTAFSQYTPITETVREALIDTCNALRLEGERFSLVRPARTVVLQGTAGEVIAAHAQVSDASLIIMATHGRTGLQRTLMGSVAATVAPWVKRPCASASNARRQGGQTHW